MEDKGYYLINETIERDMKLRMENCLKNIFGYILVGNFFFY